MPDDAREDLRLLTGDPTTQITDTRRIVAIWRGGTRFDRAAFQARIAKTAQDVAAGSSTRGPISDFEDSTLSARFSQPWIVSTDSIIGGGSRAELAVVDGGAAPGRKALAITGEVVAHAPASWAGARFSPGTRPFSPADVSKQNLRFMARGEGKTYAVMVFAHSRGRVPAIRTFQASKDFAPVRLHGRTSTV